MRFPYIDDSTMDILPEKLKNSRRPEIVSAGLLVLCGMLLAASTPILNCGFLIFIGFVPVLFVIEKDYENRRSSYGNVFLQGCFVGAFFSSMALYWIVNFSLAGAIAAMALGSCIFGVFGMGFLFGLRSGLTCLGLGFWCASLWVSMELFVSEQLIPILSISVGYTLWTQPLLIQIADITGIFGISFFVIMVNMSLLRLIRCGETPAYGQWGVTLLLMATIVGYGLWRLETPSVAGGKSLSIAALHTSVDKGERLSDDFIADTMAFFARETRVALESMENRPDLVVWPETSLPIYLRLLNSKALINHLLKLTEASKAPVLLGAKSFKREVEGGVSRYNAAFLVPVRGFIRQEYHKVILVPFVEFNPLEQWMPPWLREKFPSEFQQGDSPGIMSMGDNEKIGIVICYEANFPDYVRKSVAGGSGIMVNITNDKPAFGAYNRAYTLPLCHLVFRAIENRRSVVRCANWGISCFVSPKGEVLASSKVGEPGFLARSVPWESEMTFFTRHGFLFAQLIALTTAFQAVCMALKKRQGSKGQPDCS